MDKTELKQLSNTLNTTIQKLEKLLTSLKGLSTRNTRIDVSDIMMLAQILSIQSSISKIGNINSALNNFLDECANVFSHQTHQSRLNLPATLTDDAIYALYSLVERSPHIRTNSDSEILAAIKRIYSLRRYRNNMEFYNSLKSWGHNSLSGRRNVAKIEFHDGTILPNRQFAIPKNLPAEAISADNVAQFCIGMNLGGKRLSFTLLRHLIANRCVNILEYIIRNEKNLNKTIPPINLLLTTLIEWPSPDVKSPLQVLVAIEETYPGTIKSAEDANGNNALWFAVYLVSNWPDITSEIGKYFASCGCDLDKPFKAGFSWNTMARVITIIERHKQDETNTP